MTRRSSISLATVFVIAIATLAVVAWRFAHQPPDAHARTTTEAASDPIASARGADRQRRAAPNPIAPATAPYADLGADGVSTDDPVTAFRRQNVYPPTSRPLTAGHIDLLQPNRRHETRRPTDGDDSVEFLMTADRYFVVGDQTITPTLAVYRDGSAIAVTVTQAFAAVLDPKATADSPRYPFTVGAPFAPSTIPGLAHQTALGLFVEFDYGGVHQRARINFQYTPASAIPARFTGVFRDTALRGSLVVRAGVEVDRAGNYVIDCNLFDAQDRPIAWTRTKVQLAPGVRDVELVFFGKALVDQQARGVLHIGQLRGARFDPTRDPDLEQMPAFAGTYRTRSYQTDDFSDAEYDSPHKQEMLQFLVEQQQRGVHQGAAAPAPHGAPTGDK